MRRMMRRVRPAAILLALMAAATVWLSAAQDPPARRPAASRGTVHVTGAAAARDLASWDQDIARQLKAGDLRIRRREADALVAGRTHERLDQYHKGVRVFGGELVRQTDDAGTVSVFGTVYPGIDVDPIPTLTAADAAAVAVRLAGAAEAPAQTPDLVVVPRDSGGFALAYRARVATADDIVVFFIDARSGDLVLRYSDLQTDVGTGTGVLNDTKKVSTTLANGTYRAWDAMRPATIYTYDLKGDLSKVTRFLNGLVSLVESDLSASPNNTWSDAATVDAHAYSGWTYDYYYKQFGRSGLDGKNLTMKSIVHPVARADWSTASSSTLNLYYLNAFYAGSGIMVYGEGLPSGVKVSGYQWNYFAGALDVVAHELTHGVTDYTSDLVYRNESGALNESFSDVMGTSVEFYYQAIGTDYLRADYLLGEDLTTPMGAFRSMANPGAYGDPDHYSKRYLGTSDNGGVHTNSGISNHAFYLAVEGGTNRTSGIQVTGVGGASRDKIEKVFYRAFTQMLPSSATFSVARSATIQAARDLYGSGSNVETAVTQAWTAVGVQ